jgi:hypothetical protein
MRPASEPPVPTAACLARICGHRNGRIAARAKLCYRQPRRPAAAPFYIGRLDQRTFYLTTLTDFSRLLVPRLFRPRAKTRRCLESPSS